MFYISQIKWLSLQCHDLAKNLMRVHQLLGLGQFALRRFYFTPLANFGLRPWTGCLL